MNRRKLIAAAGAASLTAAAAVVAVGANFSLFGLTPGDARAGHLQPIVQTTATTGAPKTRTEIVYLDAPPAAAPTPSVGPSGDAAEPARSTTSGSDTEPADVPVAPADATPTPEPTATAAPGDDTHHHADDAATPDDSSETEHPDD